MGSNKQDEWIQGENDGSGGPLPLIDGKPIHIFKATGTGSFNDPCVSDPSLRGSLLL